MALLLAAAGITDIKQFGVRDKTVTTEDVLGESGDIIQPATSYTQPEYYNKATGEAINPYYDKASGNTWSGTFAGEGSTAYKVHFRPDGTPVFYTQYGGSSNDLAKLMDDLGPIGQIGLAVATGGLSIPQQIAAQLAVQVLSGKDLEDSIKSAAISFAAAQIPGMDIMGEGASFIKDLGLSEAVTNTLTNSFQNAAVSAGTALLKGDNPLEAALKGAAVGGVNGAANSILSGIPEFANLTSAQQKVVTNAITGAISGKPLDQVLINSAISLAKNEIASASKTDIRGGIQNRVTDDTTPQGNGNAAQQLTDAGLSEDDVALPPGIQTASTDGGFPLRTEISGAPIFADSGRAGSVRAPSGYTLASTTDAVMSEPARYDGNDRLLPKSDGTYYDITQNAWFKPTGEFEAVTNVEDFSKYFGQSNLSDADVANIYQGVKDGDVTADDLYWLTGQSGQPLSPADIQDIVSNISKSGGEREPATDMGEMVITAPRPPADDLGEMVITAPRDPVTDMGEMVITEPRETLPSELPPPEVITPPAVIPSSKPPVIPPAKVTPAKVTPKEIAKTLGVPVSSPVVQDIIEALYGTMEYVDIGAEFEPSKRKVKPAATQKQQQQTKMAQGGYLDTMLAEETSVDDLLNLLR
jgi:hypothetical protein